MIILSDVEIQTRLWDCLKMLEIASEVKIQLVLVELEGLGNTAL